MKANEGLIQSTPRILERGLRRLPQNKNEKTTTLLRGVSLLFYRNIYLKKVYYQEQTRFQVQET